MPALLDAIKDELASVTANRAHDGAAVYHPLSGHRPDPPPEVVIPLRASVMPSTGQAEAQSQRDRQIQLIAEKGRHA